MIDEHGKAITFLSLRERAFFGEKCHITWQSCFTVVFLKVTPSM